MLVPSLQPSRSGGQEDADYQSVGALWTGTEKEANEDAGAEVALQLAQRDLQIRPSGRSDDAGRLLGRSDDDA